MASQHTQIFAEDHDDRGYGEGDTFEQMEGWMADMGGAARVTHVVGDRRKLLVVYDLLDSPAPEGGA